MKKCKKCDERGYIKDSSIKGLYSSCECGWAIEQQKKKMEGISVDNLFAYGLKRIIEKESQAKGMNING